MSGGESKPLIYVAGPITGDPFGCVRQAIKAFDWLRSEGCVPFLPQLSVLHEMIDHKSYEEWLAYDFDVIAQCDALVRLRGDSAGADREVDYAESIGRPAFHFDQYEDGEVSTASTAPFRGWLYDWCAYIAPALRAEPVGGT